MGAAHERGVQDTSAVQVAYIASLAQQEARVLHTPNAGTEELWSDKVGVGHSVITPAECVAIVAAG